MCEAAGGTWEGAGRRALRRLREAGVPALLYGRRARARLTLVEAAFPDLITVAGDGDTTTGDLLGEYTQKPDGIYEVSVKAHKGETITAAGGF